MGIWIERQLEFMGTYRINLATTALVQMLACRHPALMSLQVLSQPSTHVSIWQAVWSLTCQSMLIGTWL